MKKYKHKLKGILRLKLFFRKENYGPKIFCIGFQKTGTTSVGNALEILGFKHATYSEKIFLDYYLNNKIDKILRYTAKFDSTDDLPWLKTDMIPLLDRTFPNSKFIYLERDNDSWKKSYHKWHLKKIGPNPPDEEKFKEFIEHRKFVKEYFKDRPKEEFLVLNVRDQDAFSKLADFVGKDAPTKKLPHLNKT